MMVVTVVEKILLMGAVTTWIMGKFMMRGLMLTALAFYATFWGAMITAKIYRSPFISLLLITISLGLFCMGMYLMKKYPGGEPRSLRKWRQARKDRDDRDDRGES